MPNNYQKQTRANALMRYHELEEGGAGSIFFARQRLEEVRGTPSEEQWKIRLHERQLERDEIVRTYLLPCEAKVYLEGEEPIEVDD